MLFQVVSQVMTLLLPIFEKLYDKSDELGENICKITYIKFLEATVVILRDYEYVNTVGINVTKLIEQSINKSKNMQSYELEVRF